MLPIIAWIVGVLGALALVMWAIGRVFPRAAAKTLARLNRSASGLELKQCQVAGLEMPYLEGGSGEPLVLVHGLQGQKENFAAVAKLLCRRYHVYIPDLPGFGEASRDLNADYHIDAQAARLMEFVDSLGLKVVHMAGNSMGGFIVSHCAATHPNRVASLWLIAPSGIHGDEETDLVRRFVATGEWPLLFSSPSDFDRFIHVWMSNPPSFPYAIRWVLGRRGVADRELHRKIAKQALLDSPSLSLQQKQIQTPALIVWGAKDQILHPSGSKAFQAMFPKSAVELLPDCGHVAMLEAPEETAKSYMRFREEMAK
jgi:pimeloyl-ACP methyl ester carboxylesterase